MQIKDTVMAQHSEWKSRVEEEKSLKKLKRGRVDGDWLVEEVPQKSARAEIPAKNEVDRDWLVEEVPPKSARAETPAQNLPKEASLL